MSQISPPTLSYASPTAGFVSAAGRGKTAIILLWINLGLLLLSAGSDYMQVALLERARSGQGVSVAEADANDQRQALLGGVRLLGILSCAIVFLMWVNRSNKNLQALSGQTPEISSGWSVGYFFIPFVNLVKPFKILGEIWNKSSGDAYNTKTPSVVGGWWGLWILGGFISRISTGMLKNPSPENISTLINGTWLSIVSDVVALGSGLLAIKMISTIVRMQGDGSSASPSVTNPYPGSTPPPPMRTW